MKAKVQEERPISPSSVSSKLNSPSTHDSALASPRVPDVIIDDDDDDDDDDNVDVQDGDETGDNAMPVPQVMLGPDGNIVLNDARYVKNGLCMYVYKFDLFCRILYLWNHTFICFSALIQIYSR